MTIVIASGDRQRLVIVADTVAVEVDGRRPRAFISKVQVFAHVLAAAVVRGNGGVQLAIYTQMTTRAAPGGIGELPWPAILDRYIGDGREPFDCILAGWSPAAGGLAVWQIGDATGYDLTELVLPASVALPGFGVELDPLMTDTTLVKAAELQVDLANESGREREGPNEPDGAGGDLILTELTAAGIVQRKVRRLANYEALKEQMAR